MPVGTFRWVIGQVNSSSAMCVFLEARARLQFPAAPGARALYPTTSVFEYPQLGHSNVRRSWPGSSGSIRASSIIMPHSGHGGRVIEAECAAGARSRVMRRSRNKGGSATGLSPSGPCARPLPVMSWARRAP
jgi:hypothetical protein